MNFEEAVRNCFVIREEHKDSLIANLRRIPEFSWLTGDPHSKISRLQGDFFKEFPVVFLRPDGTAISRQKPVMILNNSCDLVEGQGTMVSVALVLDLERYLASQAAGKSKESLAAYERDIRANKISELLFIPYLPGFSTGAIVRLDMICSVPMSFLQESEKSAKRMASFSQSGFYLLLMKLTYHLTRAESREAHRN